MNHITKIIQKYSKFFLLLTSTVLFIRPVHDPDLWWHLGVGKYIWTTKSIPYTDIFSFSVPDYPYVYHSWLSSLTLYIIHTRFQLWGITILYALLGAFTLFLIQQTLIKILSNTTSNYKFINYYLLLTIPLFIYTTNLRTQLFSLLFLSLIIYLIVDYLKKSTLKIWFIPIIFIFWANFHGGFILGLYTFLIIIIILLISHQPKLPHLLKTLIQIFSLSIFTPLFNPYFYRIYQQVYTMGSNQFAFKFNSDWHPIVQPADLPSTIFGSFILIAILIIFSIKNKTPLYLKLSTLPFATLSFTYSRRFALPLITLLILSLGITILPHLKNQLEKITKFPPLYNLITTLLLLLIISPSITWLSLTYQLYQSPANYAKYINAKNKPVTYPYPALQHYQTQNYPQPIFNDFNWGGYLTWNLPHQKIFIDGRMDNFIIEDQSFAYQYAQVVNATPQWSTILDKYHIQTIFISSSHPIVQVLNISPQWQLKYRDDIAVIYTKNKIHKAI